MSKFLQLHLLTSYPASLLNRDDLGQAKRITFGGRARTRISSQCLKRHWRTHEGRYGLGGLGVGMAIRSRATFDKCIYAKLVESGVAVPLAGAVTEALMLAVLGQSPKAKAKQDAKAKGAAESGAASGDFQTSQITVLGAAEVDYLLAVAREVCEAETDPKKAGEALKAKLGKEGKKNLEALKKAASGLDAAMFGRMVTSDILARGDAAVHVAHAFTVHAEAVENDYFSAVDELLKQEDGQQGSGHINSAELTSGLYYLYAVVDLPLLVANLEGTTADDADRSLAAQVVEAFTHLAATVSPGAKLGATAPHAYAHLVLAELGDAQPRTLANAFLKPVTVSEARPDLLANAYQALQKHLTELDCMYPTGERRKLAAIGPTEELAAISSPIPLPTLAQWVAEEVRGAGRALAQA